MEYEPDDTIAATGGGNDIFFWNYKTGETINTIPQAHNANSWDLCRVDEERIATSSNDRNLKLWDVTIEEFQTPVLTFEGGHTSNIDDVAYYEPDDRLFSTGTDSKICVWSLEDASLLDTWHDHTAAVYGLCPIETHQYLATGAEDNTVKLFALERGHECIRTYSDHSAVVLHIAYDPVREILITGADDQTSCVFSVLEERLEHRIRIGCNVKSVARSDFSEHILALGGSDGVLRFYDLRNLSDDEQQKSAHLLDFPAHSSGIRRVVALDETTWATASEDSWCHIISFSPDPILIEDDEPSTTSITTTTSDVSSAVEDFGARKLHSFQNGSGSSLYGLAFLGGENLAREGVKLMEDTNGWLKRTDFLVDQSEEMGLFDLEVSFPRMQKSFLLWSPFVGEIPDEDLVGEDEEEEEEEGESNSPIMKMNLEFESEHVQCDETIIRRLLLGYPVSHLSIPDMDLFDYFLFFQLLKMPRRAYLFCERAQQVKDTKTLLWLLKNAKEREERLVQESMEGEGEEEEKLVVDLIDPLGQPFIYAIGGVLHARMEEVENLVKGKKREEEIIALVSSFRFSEIENLPHYASILSSPDGPPLTHYREAMRHLTRLHQAKKKRRKSNLIVRSSNGTEFRTHLQILLWRSSFFVALSQFGDADTEAVLTLRDVVVKLMPGTVEQLLRSIYNVPVETHDVPTLCEVLVHADMYRDEFLEDSAMECVKALSKKRVAEGLFLPLVDEFVDLFDHLSIRSLLVNVWKRACVHTDEYLEKVISQSLLKFAARRKLTVSQSLLEEIRGDQRQRQTQLRQLCIEVDKSSTLATEVQAMIERARALE